MAVCLLGAPIAVAAAQEPVFRDLARVQLKQPWLRIKADGHTGSVQALAFTSDSTRLCSAGLDKNVQVWNLTAVYRDLRRVFLRERVIRWQVGRGLRGSIYALAAAPGLGDAGPLLAIGGYGATGATGEILLVDPRDGSLVKVLKGHRQTVCALAFSTDGRFLASSDTEGATRLWPRDTWQPVLLQAADRKVYGADRAALIENQPKFRPVVVVGNRHVFLPALDDQAAADQAAAEPLRWKLKRIALADHTDVATLGPEHLGMVTALAVSPDGTRLASADMQGNLHVRRLEPDGKVTGLKPQSTVISLCFSRDGDTLFVGTANVPAAKSKSQLQVWDLKTPELRHRRPLPDHVNACVLSPDGRRLAYTGGKDHEVFLARFEQGQLDPPEQAVALRGKGRRVFKVAFAKKEPLYRVAFGTVDRPGPYNDYADLDTTFDPAALVLDARPPPPDEWLTAEDFRGEWSVRLLYSRELARYVLRLNRGQQPKGIIRLDPRLEGTPRCYTWIPDAKGKPAAIAVGTDVQNSIYVFALAEEGFCPILRHFRGHHDYVTSIGASADGRYLVSGSADGAVCFWSLSGYRPGKTPPERAVGDIHLPPMARWGAELAVRDGRLVATDVDPAGPLLSKGLRPGDVIERIRWFADGEVRSEKRPAEMLKRLGDLPWATQVAFDLTRDGKPQEPFQRLPAWEPLATLFAAANRQWAFWTPAGYYDASPNGHRLFGWQVNRGLDALPDFYRADQFYRKLERPDVMRHLLPAGSLREAFRQAAVEPPRELHRTLPEQIAATPRVKILAPAPGTRVAAAATKVRARIDVPEDWKLVRAKAFANGVVATGRKLLEETPGENRRELTYEWDVALPQDRRNLIQVVVATDAPTAAFDHVLIERAAQPPQAPAGAALPRLFIVAVGIDRYGDPAIRPLSFCVADAQAVIAMLKQRCRGLYELGETTLLANEQATPAGWQQALRQLRTRLTDVVEPNDLLVFFFAGHGIVDGQTGDYYFVGHDLRAADLERRVFSHGISLDDFRTLADVPCRKLALLDTCHAGAIQPLSGRDLKPLVRRLQEDVIFTVTASTGAQRSAEKEEWKHGAFTLCLLEALGGRADASRDGLVTLDEMVDYVGRSVSQLTGGLQTPTAAPDEILPYTSLPLTRVEE